MNEYSELSDEWGRSQRSQESSSYASRRKLKRKPRWIMADAFQAPKPTEKFKQEECIVLDLHNIPKYKPARRKYAGAFVDVDSDNEELLDEDLAMLGTAVHQVDQEKPNKEMYPASLATECATTSVAQEVDDIYHFDSAEDGGFVPVAKEMPGGASVPEKSVVSKTPRRPTFPPQDTIDLQAIGNQDVIRYLDRVGIAYRFEPGLNREPRIFLRDSQIAMDSKLLDKPAGERFNLQPLTGGQLLVMRQKTTNPERSLIFRKLPSSRALERRRFIRNSPDGQLSTVSNICTPQVVISSSIPPGPNDSTIDDSHPRNDSQLRPRYVQKESSILENAGTCTNNLQTDAKCSSVVVKLEQQDEMDLGPLQTNLYGAEWHNNVARTRRRVRIQVNGKPVLTTKKFQQACWFAHQYWQQLLSVQT